MKKNILITFFFACIPGAGQMYQEYMKRGLSIMTLAGIFLILVALIGSPIFIIPLLIIMAYSFFDTFNIRNKKNPEDQPKDEYIWETFGISNIVAGINSGKKNKLIGYALIIVGAYILCNNVFSGIIYESNIDILIKIMHMLQAYVPAIIISALSIGVGIKLLNIKEK
ncbi:MAG: hypothetical protein RR922_06635 [Clostridia bacterium]